MSLTHNTIISLLSSSCYFSAGLCLSEQSLNALIDVGSCASVLVNGLFVKRPKSVEECVLDPLSVTLQKNHSKSFLFHMAAMR